MYEVREKPNVDDVVTRGTACRRGTVTPAQAPKCNKAPFGALLFTQKREGQVFWITMLGNLEE